MVLESVSITTGVQTSIEIFADEGIECKVFAVGYRNSAASSLVDALVNEGKNWLIDTETAHEALQRNLGRTFRFWKATGAEVHSIQAALPSVLFNCELRQCTARGIIPRSREGGAAVAREGLLE